MAIDSSSSTFLRFHVEDPVKKQFWEHVEQGLKSGAFQGLEEDRHRSAGFTSWDDVFDASFTQGSHSKGEYVAFRFRLDRRRVAPIVLRQHQRAAILRHREENGGVWPTKKEKERIREEVIDRLMSQALPQPTVCDVVWNTREGWLLTGATGRTLLEALWAHLEDHLRVYPVPLYHARWASRLLPGSGPEASALASLVSLESPDALAEGRGLGYEFLTWVWYFSEEEGGEIEIGEDRTAAVHVGERMILSRPDDGRERVVCTTPAVSLHEARTALRRGKRVEQAQLQLEVGESAYSLRLDADLWAVRSLKTPKQSREIDRDDADGRFFERVFFLEEVFACLDALYRRFLERRLAKDWSRKSWPAVESWFAQKGA